MPRSPNRSFIPSHVSLRTYAHTRVSGLAYSGVFRPTDGRLIGAGDDGGVVRQTQRQSMRSINTNSYRILQCIRPWRTQGFSFAHVIRLCVCVCAVCVLIMAGDGLRRGEQVGAALPDGPQGGGARGAVAAGRPRDLLRLGRPHRGALLCPPACPPACLPAFALTWHNAQLQHPSIHLTWPRESRAGPPPPAAASRLHLQPYPSPLPTD